MNDDDMSHMRIEHNETKSLAHIAVILILIGLGLYLLTGCQTTLARFQ